MSFNDRSSEIVGDGGRIQVQNDGMVRFGSDANMNVLFYDKLVLDAALSQLHGRPMKVSRTYVRIQHPGERDCADDPVENKPGITQRFSRQWEQYQKAREQIPDGTPVEILFPQHLEIAANLHAFGVHTIEQLSNLTEHGAQSIGMGVTQWRNQAKDFLSKANAHVGYHQWAKEKSQMENTIEVQGNQIAQLKSQLDKVLAQLQGVPGAMIPNGVGTQAGGHAASVVLPMAPKVDWTVAGVAPTASPPAWPAKDWMDGTVATVPMAPKSDWTAQAQQTARHVEARSIANEAARQFASENTFDPYASGLQGAQINPLPATPPQAPGRPRGRPRKTPKVAEGNS